MRDLRFLRPPFDARESVRRVQLRLQSRKVRHMQRSWGLGRVLLSRVRDTGEGQGRVPEDYKLRECQDGFVLPQESRRGDNGGRGEDVLILIARLEKRKRE